MAESLTIARPYADAVFRLADQKGTLAAWSEILAGMAQVAENPEMGALFDSPKLTRQQLADVFIAACPDLSEEGLNLVNLLVENGRLPLLPEICALFEEFKRDREGVVEAKIVSAFPVDDDETAALVAGLERKLRRRVQASVTVDPELIGGVQIVVGDQVIDGSVRARLATMAAALKS